MNNSVKLLLLAAASTGLMSGTSTATQVNIPTQNGSSASSMKLAGLAGTATTIGDDTAKHSCKGMNSCKGQGGCKTSDMGCKAKNSCKG